MSFSLREIKLLQPFKPPFYILFWIPEEKRALHSVALVKWDGKNKIEAADSNPTDGALIDVMGTPVYIPSHGSVVQLIVFGNAIQRGGTVGRITAAQGNSKSTRLKNHFFEVEFGPGVKNVGEVVWSEHFSGLFSLLAEVVYTTTSFSNSIQRKTELAKGYKFLSPEFHNVDQPFIACQAGVMPRDLFYYSMDHAGITDEWLFAQLDVYFYMMSWPRTKPTTRLELVERATQIVIALTVYAGQFNYQPDRIMMEGDKQLEVEHFSKTALMFEAGDCEELAWTNAIVLNRLTRRVPRLHIPGMTREECEFLNMCTEVMDHYIVINALCKATAPDMSGAGRGFNFHEEVFKRKKALEETQSMSAWHMTCFLMPKNEFLRSVGVDLEGHYIYPSSNPEWELPRLYGEGTAIIYPNPEERLLDDPKKVQTFIQNCGERETCSMLPSNENFREDTCLYGPVLQVMTDYFLQQSEPQFECTIFEESIVTDEGEIVGVCENNYSNCKRQIKFSPTISVLEMDKRVFLSEPPLLPLTIDLAEVRRKKLLLPKQNHLFGWYYTRTPTPHAWPAHDGIYMRFA